MEKVEIIATTGNKFQIPGGINNQKTYKRTITIQNKETIDNELRIYFESTEKEKFDDFISRINHLGGTDSYYLHFITDNKWIESRIIEADEAEPVVNFLIFKEDLRIAGSILEI